MADRMTAAEWNELDRLARKARFDPTTSKASATVLHNVSLYASRMGGRLMAEIIDLATPLRHICEVCGKDEILTPEEAFSAGWDYPPRMGSFGVISPRTCGSCGVESTVWWALAMENKAGDELTEAQMDTIVRIQSEPQSIIPEQSL